jgi:hypothetical protein
VRRSCNLSWILNDNWWHFSMATLAELGGVGDTTTEYHRPHRMHPGIGIAMKNPQKTACFQTYSRPSTVVVFGGMEGPFLW